jgi:hypothetical protein
LSFAHYTIQNPQSKIRNPFRSLPSAPCLTNTQSNAAHAPYQRQYRYALPQAKAQKKSTKIKGKIEINS